jgi:hypothetical protein
MAARCSVEAMERDEDVRLPSRAESPPGGERSGAKTGVVMDSVEGRKEDQGDKVGGVEEEVALLFLPLPIRPALVLRGMAKLSCVDANMSCSTFLGEGEARVEV